MDIDDEAYPKIRKSTSKWKCRVISKVEMHILPLLVLLAVTPPADYKAQIEKWRAERETRLKSDTGWLTVAGLFWLQEGANSIGTSESDRIQLPKPVPEHAGVIEFHDGKATLTIDPGTGAKVNGHPAKTAVLQSDLATKGKPDVVTIGDLTFFVIERGERFGIRLKDKNSEMRRNFQGLEWYPVDPEWRMVAKWVRYPQPKQIEMDSMTGDKEKGSVPGYAKFTVDGKEYELEPTVEGDELFFVFRDKTAGKMTYPAARFLYAKPEGDRVVLDFNKAYNPPCAFTPYATCPLPTPGNRLPIEIPAGELKYKGGIH
jgi:uncharacterized protein (DUF1684 family)